MSSSWALMKVAVIQAIPNSAIADTMPARNTDISGIVFTSGLPRKRITTPTVNITRTMVLVMSRGTDSPSVVKLGRRSGNRPRTTIISTPKRNARAELRPRVVAVRAADARVGGEGLGAAGEAGPDGGTLESAVVVDLAPVATTLGSDNSGWFEAAAAGRGGSRPARIFSCTCGSSTSSLPILPTTKEVTTMPTMQAGRVMARIWVSPKLYSLVSVSVNIAAMAADTGEAARATPDWTTVTDSGREGRMPLRYDTS